MKPKYGTVSVTETYASSNHSLTSDVDSERDANSSSPATPPAEIHNDAPTSSTRFRWLVMALLGFIILIFEGSNALMLAPQVGVWKEKICLSLSVSLGSDVAPDYCEKSPEVQRKLSLLIGGTYFLQTIPMLLLSTYFGSLADRWGRRPIIILSFLGMALNSSCALAVSWAAPKISIYWVWLAPMFLCVGGGSGVAVAIIFACAADVVSAENRVNAFAILHATSLGAALLATLISSMMMMRYGNWVPLLWSVLVQFAGLAILFLLPDTKPSLSAPSTTEFHDEMSDTSPSSPLLGRSVPTLDAKKDSAWSSMLISLQYMWSTSGVFPLMIIAFIMLVGSPVAILTLQYMPYRFGISLAESNLYNMVNYGVSLFVLLVLMPSVGAVLLRSYKVAFKKDMTLAHMSCAVSLLGGLVMALAPNVAVAAVGVVFWALGIGLGALVRSIFIDLFPPEDAAFSTTLISVVKALANALSYPTMSVVYSWSLRFDGILSRLPFLITVICFSIAQICLTLVKMPSRPPTKPVGLVS